MAGTSRPRAPLGPLETSESFGRYELVDRIGLGGMAEVFRATTSWAAGVHKEVCIKRILPPLTGDARMREMFIQEARIAAELTHANIVPVYEFGIIDEYYFLSMELVDGFTVRDIMMQAARRKKWPDVSVVLHVVTEVLEGLDYAHRRHDAEGAPLAIVHRDITPGNVMVSRAGEVKLLDFGIGLVISGDDEGGGISGVKGKPGYMAPEQAVGMAVDGRADIFGVGVLLWEMLCHQRLFREKSAAERLRRTEPVPKPTTINPDIPPSLDTLVLRALEAKPAERWRSAALFRDALQDYMHREGIRAGRSTVSNALGSLFDLDGRKEGARLPEWTSDIRNLSGDDLDRGDLRPPRGQRDTREARAISSVGSASERGERMVASARRARLTMWALAVGLPALGVAVAIYMIFGR